MILSLINNLFFRCSRYLNHFCLIYKMESNSTEEVPPTPIIEEHSEHADYHFIEIVIYPFYLTLLFVLCAAISLNKRKFAKR